MNTPTTWKYTGHKDHCDIGRSYHEIISNDGFEVANQNGILSEEDARLAAASPELRTALEDAKSMIDELSKDTDTDQLIERFGERLANIELVLDKATPA